MQELITQLGIDWRSLASQAVNFLILLAVLRALVYKPVLKILKERKAKVEEGLVKAKEADRRLHEVDEVGREKLKEAESKALQMLRATEEKAKGVEAKLLEEAEKKEAEALKRTEVLLKAKAEESRLAMKKEAVKLVKDAIIKTVELSPEKVDEALIQKAVEGVSSS